MKVAVIGTGVVGGSMAERLLNDGHRVEIFDVDPTFSNTEEYWLSIPENIRPHKDQPFYHLLAENDESSYVAYVSEQNLLPDDTGKPPVVYAAASAHNRMMTDFCSVDRRLLATCYVPLAERCC